MRLNALSICVSELVGAHPSVQMTVVRFSVKKLR
jgi:hypothetical protein